MKNQDSTKRDHNTKLVLADKYDKMENARISKASREAFRRKPYQITK